MKNLFLILPLFVVSCSDPNRVKGLSHSDAYYPENDFYLNCPSTLAGALSIFSFKRKNYFEQLKGFSLILPTKEEHLDFEFFEFGISTSSFTLIKADTEELTFQGKTRNYPEYNFFSHVKIYLPRNFNRNINGMDYLEYRIKEFRDPIDNTKPIIDEIASEYMISLPKPTNSKVKCLLISKDEFLEIENQINRGVNESELFKKWKQRKSIREELSKNKDTVI